MTVIRPNSISGITSLTAHRGSIDFYAHDGSAARFDNINSNVTSGVSTFASLNITGDLDVGGALTYEDVTNIDSVGIITARSAIVLSDDNAIHFRGVVTDDADAILRASAGGGQLLINSRNDTIINIDSNNDSSDAHFAVGHGAATGSSTELFKVQESGDVTQNSGTFTIKAASGDSSGLKLSQESGDESRIFNHFSGPLTFGTGNTERLRITSAGIHKISTAGSTNDGTFFSTLTINNTGSNTYSRVRFDRSGVARFGLTLRNDDKFCISNLFKDGSVSADDNAFVMDAYSKIGINETSPTARLDINHPHTEQGLVVRSRYGNIATAMVKFDADPDSDGGDGNVLHLHGGSSRTDSEILHIDSTGVGDIFDIRGDGLTRVYKQLQLEHSSNVAKIIFNEYGANDPKAQIEMDQINGDNGQLRFYTEGNGSLSERLRITSDGHLVYDTNKGGIYNFDKACGSNTTTNIFRIDNSHGAHCFTIYMTGSNSGNSVSKIYHVACKYGSAPTINSAADTGSYSGNNFSLTGSASGQVHTFAITTTGAAATISCTVVLGSMTTSATVTVL